MPHSDSNQQKSSCCEKGMYATPKATSVSKISILIWLQSILYILQDNTSKPNYLYLKLSVLLCWPQNPFITQKPRPKQIHKSSVSFIAFTQPGSSGWLTATELFGPAGRRKKKHDPPAAMDASYQALCVPCAGRDMAAP